MYFLSTLKVKLREVGASNKYEECTVQAFMASDFDNTKSTDYNNKNKEYTNKKYNTNNLKNIRCCNWKKKDHYAVNCKELRKESE